MHSGHEWPEYLALFFLGSIIGSFLNVVIYRVPAGLSLVKPGSHCPKCNRPIKPWENIPVLSFLLLRGKCAGCKLRIPVRYPLVEAIMGGLVMLMLYKFGWTWELLIYSVLCGFLLALSAIDLATYRLPNAITLTGSIFAVLLTLFFRREFWLNMLSGGVVGIGVLVLQGVVGWLVVRLIFRRDSSTLGMGDIKFAGMVGLFLGPWKILGMYFFGIFLGAIFGVLIMLSGDRKSGKIPFGPYLAGGALVALMWGDQIWHWYSPLLSP